MAITKLWSAIGPLLRVLVEETPGVNRAIVHTNKGWPVASWPANSFFRTAMTAFLTPSLLLSAEEFDRKIRIRNHDCIVTELSGRILLIITIGQMCLTADASKSCDLRVVRAGIARVIDDIADVLMADGGYRA
jgi:predicted regulator of Ras-like GTPase activity (Roadblock/LC7/MglB family)